MKKNLIIFIFFLFTVTVFPSEVLKEIVSNRVFVLDNAGNIYCDYNQNSIIKYSPKGEMLLQIGQKGEGAGDIKRMFWFAINPLDNTLLVPEFYGGNKWISKFSCDGKYLGAWKCEFDRNKFAVPGNIKFDNKGNILMVGVKSHFRSYKDFNLNTSENHLLKFSSDGRLLNTIYKLTTDTDGEKRGNFGVTIPFQNVMSWAIFNDKIIVKEQSENVIFVFSPDGKLEKKIPFPVKKVKVTEKDLDDWENWMKSVKDIKEAIARGVGNTNYWRKKLPIPIYKPNSMRMLTDSKGNLYIEEYTDDLSLEHSWFKINLENGNTTTIKFKPGERLKYIWKNFFFLEKEDENDDTIILKLDEKEVFNR